jgi:predicted nucleic acid-binding protein
MMYAGQQDAWVRNRIFNHKDSFEDILRRRGQMQLDASDLNDVSVQVYDKFLKPFVDPGIIQVVSPKKDENWNDITTIMREHVITIGDAFALACAQAEQCNVFVTRDERLEEIVSSITQMLVGAPSEINVKLKKKGLPVFWEDQIE